MYDVWTPTQTVSVTTYCISFIESHTQVTRTNQPALQICRTPQSTRSMHRARGNKVWVMCWLGVTKSCSMNRANTRGRPPRSLSRFAAVVIAVCICTQVDGQATQVGAKGKRLTSVAYSTTITVYYTMEKVVRWRIQYLRRYGRPN